MHGYVARLRDVFETIDALFVPSRAEGLPTAVIEARLAGRWVAGWKCTGIPEAAGPDGILVSPSEGLRAMADAIAAVLRSGRRPPAAPDGRFEHERMINDYAEVLRSTTEQMPTEPKWTS
jgi:glycosyltransferase involved in cell wall biosynthesis